MTFFIILVEMRLQRLQPLHITYYFTFELHRNHGEAPRQVKCLYLLNRFDFPLLPRQTPQCETDSRVILAKASTSLSCSQLVFGGFQGNGDVSSPFTLKHRVNMHTHTHNSAWCFLLLSCLFSPLCFCSSDLSYIIVCPVQPTGIHIQIYRLSMHHGTMYFLDTNRSLKE